MAGTRTADHVVGLWVQREALELPRAMISNRDEHASGAATIGKAHFDDQRVIRITASSRGGMQAIARPRLAPALVDGHVAIVDPLLVHPLPPRTFFSGQ
jgi:hypothetical protein